MIPGPQAVKEGIIWSAWQLRPNSPMAVPPQLQPGQPPELTGVGTDASQVERDHLSHVAFVHVFTQKVSIMQDLTES